ncbi:hypothetical protein FRB95_007858 [Tulasnella sp. JGI-2019a]|nr:hypothetical protein FRB95_007858 [Tulasnella sp. JGI-2019a]
MLSMRLAHFVCALASLGAVTAAPAAAQSTRRNTGPIKPKVLIVDMFVTEAEAWYGIPEFDLLAQNITVPGLSPLFPDVHCTANSDVCQVITGQAEINAATSIASLVLSPSFDLTSTYILIGGIAGANPNQATVGSVSFARYAVQVGLQYEIDGREIPSNFSTGYFPISSVAPGQYPTKIYGTEVFEFNDDLRKLAVGFASKAKLSDSDDNKSYRANYPQAAAKAGPTVVACDVVTDDTWFSGDLIDDAFDKSMTLLTNGTGVYCATAQEDNATAEALLRAALHKKVDFSRIILMRTFGNFDRPYPGESALQNLVYSPSGLFMPSIMNIYLAGVKVVEGILKDWDSTFEQGVKATNYVGDIFGSLGGTPDFGPGKSTEPVPLSTLRRRNVRRQGSA